MNALRFGCFASQHSRRPSCFSIVVFFMLMVLVSGWLAPLHAQTVRLPETFNWKQIPATYAGKTLEVFHHYNTTGFDIVLPQNVTLRFNGGAITGAKTITGINAQIINPANKPIFIPETRFFGTFVKTVATPEWFGAKGDTENNDARALEAALTNFGTVQLSGSYFISKASIQIINPVTINGTGKASVRGDGSNETRLVIKNSLSVNNIHFSHFRFCLLFDHDALIKDIKVINCRFTETEKPIFASNSNLKQTLTHIEIRNNQFTHCISGVELLARVRYVTICENTFQDLGSPTLSAQSNAIRLGNTAINFLTDKTMGDYVIAGNSITNVFCGINAKGREGYECHAIFATGTGIEILNNKISNVYNGGSGTNPRNKTGSEGIYVKASACTIAGNQLINAGYGEGAICAKGFGIGLVIRDNSVTYNLSIADNPQLITCYYAGALSISNNALRSINPGTTGIKLCAQGLVPSVATIIKNDLGDLKGYAFRIYNLQPGAIINLENNTLAIEGDVLKEESTLPYLLSVTGNSIQVTNGVFMPASTINQLTFTLNTVTLSGKTFMANLRRSHCVEHNRFVVRASLPDLPLFVMNGNSRFNHNVVIVEGSFRNILMFAGDTATHITGNQITLTGQQGKADRVVFINTATPNLNITLSKNSFKGNSLQKNNSLVAVSNAGAGSLTLENNTADKHTGVFAELLSQVGHATFNSNKTGSPSGFITNASLQKIRGKWSASRTTGIPGNQTGN